MTMPDRNHTTNIKESNIPRYLCSSLKNLVSIMIDLFLIFNEEIHQTLLPDSAYTELAACENKWHTKSNIVKKYCLI